MEERDLELPVATMRPRHLLGRMAFARGALRRWLRERLRAAFRGRHAPLLLTGVVFSAMMLTMGYVADHAHRAGVAIDQAHREQREAALLDAVMVEAPVATIDDPWASAVRLDGRAQPSPVLFYVRR